MKELKNIVFDFQRVLNLKVNNKNIKKLTIHFIFILNNVLLLVPLNYMSHKFEILLLIVIIKYLKVN